MFGDKNLIGYYEDIKVDKKGRFFLPAKTNKEQGDEILVVYDKDLDFYKLYHIDLFDTIVANYKTLISKAETEEERIKYDLAYLNFCKSILMSVKVDSQGRINLNEIFDNDTSVSLIGRGDHLVLQRKNTNNK